ncbi:hypothetical protein AB1Y20_006136 [Prymnesium parvum]|uniref:Non-reducing end alpha-L-arabinofuranosidase n=1 Tax=Prymnesium parvum TaxID=97485 RepID=A0AB34J345_PRYPA
MRRLNLGCAVLAVSTGFYAVLIVHWHALGTGLTQSAPHTLAPRTRPAGAPSSLGVDDEATSRSPRTNRLLHVIPLPPAAPWRVLEHAAAATPAPSSSSASEPSSSPSPPAPLPSSPLFTRLPQAMRSSSPSRTPLPPSPSPTRAKKHPNEHRRHSRAWRSQHRREPRKLTVTLPSRRAAVVSSRQVCVSLDWWPADKCDYSRCPWAGGSMLSANLSDPLLVAAARSLAPFLLRLGGSLADQVVYEDEAGCAPEQTPLSPNQTSAAAAAACGRCGGFVRDVGLRVGFRGGCLPAARWEQLVQFCEAVGCQIVFSINALFGRRREACPDETNCRSARPTPSCCTNYSVAGGHASAAGWDASNARMFLQRAARRGSPLAAVAFGNEIGGDRAIEAHFPAAVYAAGLRHLRELVDELWAGMPAAVKPRVIGPNAQWDSVWVAELLREAPWLRTVSHHLYPLGAGSIEVADLVSKVLRPDFLDKLKVIAAHAASSVQASSNSSSPQRASGANGGTVELWVTELGGAYNSGRPGVTDSFVSSFWFLDALGTLSRYGTQVVCRQTLLGGNYGLLALGGHNASGDDSGPPPRRVNVDYYSLLLWRRLMGPIVLQPRVDGLSSRSENAERGGNAARLVRLYAACTAPSAGFAAGAVSLLALNLKLDSPVLSLSSMFSTFVQTAPGEGNSSGVNSRIGCEEASVLKRKELMRWASGDAVHPNTGGNINPDGEQARANTKCGSIDINCFVKRSPKHFRLVW